MEKSSTELLLNLENLVKQPEIRTATTETTKRGQVCDGEGRVYASLLIAKIQLARTTMTKRKEQKHLLRKR